MDIATISPSEAVAGMKENLKGRIRSHIAWAREWRSRGYAKEAKKHVRLAASLRRESLGHDDPIPECVFWRKVHMTDEQLRAEVRQKNARRSGQVEWMEDDDAGDE